MEPDGEKREEGLPWGATTLKQTVITNYSTPSRPTLHEPATTIFEKSVDLPTLLDQASSVGEPPTEKNVN